MSTETDDSGTLKSIFPPDQVDRVFRTCDDHGWKLLIASAVVGALPPVLGLQSGYYMTVLSEMYLFAILALSWDIVGGQTGYPSFGNMAFFGIGAYTTAILVKDFAVAFPAAFLVAGLVATVFALVIGIIVLRLRGHYFAIATLGVLLAAQQVSRNLDITGGASGKILLETPSGTEFYYLFLGVLVVEAAVVYYLSSTRFGFVLNAIRDDEGKATAMGFNTTYYKTAAWMLAALFTGFAGGAYSLFNTFIDPQTAYNGAWNVELIAMALLGGSGTVVGPIIGAFGLHTVIEIVESYAVGWQLVLLGLSVIVTVIAIPEGLVGSLRQYASQMEYYKHGGMAAADGEADSDEETSPAGGDSP
ncbi:branched-chain amino acid ABC transporter permease [Haloarcula sp. GH36]|uniref:branched-chain amino acid ABC transporter permease n=1 Tax=Haloarcula montana TaxID=3111776 RepID=UPI002D794849|nr:branched-chain amino acid ABC transporter permease [Haloarcula sp. GH36]